MEENDYPKPTSAPPILAPSREETLTAPPPSPRPSYASLPTSRPATAPPELPSSPDRALPESSTARSDPREPSPSHIPAPASLTLPTRPAPAMLPPQPSESPEPEDDAADAMSRVRQALAHARHKDRKHHYREAMDEYGDILDYFRKVLKDSQLTHEEREELKSIVDNDHERFAALRRLDAAGDLHNAPSLPKPRPPPSATEPSPNFRYLTKPKTGKRKKGEREDDDTPESSKRHRVQPSIEHGRNDSLGNLEQDAEVQPNEESSDEEDPAHNIQGRRPGFTRASTPLPGRIENLGDSNPKRGLTTCALAHTKRALCRRRTSGGHALDYQLRDHNHAHFEAGGCAKGFDTTLARMAADMSSSSQPPPDVH
ncbi:hypothetical protein CLAFUR0_00309 [Fulvia fulva]|nr:hypothetical protein CLAFUR0_00309 [Fulvia fulva]